MAYPLIILYNFWDRGAFMDYLFYSIEITQKSQQQKHDYVNAFIQLVARAGSD